MNERQDELQVEPSGSNPRTARPRTPQRARGLAVLAGALLTMGLVAGCGDDESPEEAFCSAGDSLESNIEGLGDIDLVSEGTNALDQQFSAIQSDLDELRDSGSDVAADEIAALETAVDALGDDLNALGDDISAESASAVGDSLNSVVTTAQAVVTRLQSTCP